MPPLAHEIYKHLLRRVRANQPSITYGELAAGLPARHATHHRSPRLHAALGEIALACRALGLPCLPAIVWSRELRRPSDGYYKVAHPRSRSEKSRVAAWEREHAAVVRDIARYPATLPATLLATVSGADPATGSATRSGNSAARDAKASAP
ncbi:MAG: hypothetical protein H0T89_13780 [Deltaproteobacteria bacterium]|nr:hypothetical protein [Deltaproteobacteria bacterium]MDQ3299005.1 hypothetical protein [Myxococcota bacterium]